MSAVLSVDNLEIGYRDADGADVTLLRGVSLSLGRGEIISLVGESGCGKSVTAKAILGVLPENLDVRGGSIHCEDKSLLDLDEAGYQALRGRAFTLVPQHPLSSLNPVFTVGAQFFDLIAFQGRTRVGVIDYWRPRLSRTRRREIRERTIEALREVSLPSPEELVDRYPLQLSGGQSQRVLIALALLGDPKIVIADEPGTALDVTIEAQINDLLLERVQARHTSMIYITHDLGIASKAIREGCAFRWRCPHATDACAAAVPPLDEIGTGHRAACIRARELERA